jgi:gluconolactonase
VCQNGGRVGEWLADHPCTPSIQRVSPGGVVDSVATEIDGVRFQAPNDLVFGRDGRLYFTDPGRYRPRERPDAGYIFALAVDGAGEVIVELPPVFPNGIAAEISGGIVWAESYTRAVRRWQDGRVEDICVLDDETHVPDGLAVASDGSLYVCTVYSRGIDIIDRDGSVEFLPVGDVPTNCTFAGSTLYVTDGGAPGEGRSSSRGGKIWALDCDRITGMPTFRGFV